MNTMPQDDSLRITSYQWMMFCLCWLAGIFAGMNANLFSLMLPQAMQEVLGTNDRAAISQMGSYILSLFLIGWMAGGLVFGVVGDRFGRVRALTISIVLYALSTGVVSFATFSWQIAFCRFLTGFGVGGCMLSISVMLAENWPSRSRAVAIGALITSYQVGVFLSGLVGSIFPYWREAFLMGAWPVAVALMTQCRLKESRAWIERPKMEKYPLVVHLRNLFGSAHGGNLLIGSLAFGGLLVGYWASVAWVPTWIQDLALTEGGQEKNWATMWHAIAAIGGCFAAGWLANAWGRLPVIGMSCGGAFLVSAAMFLIFDEFSVMIYWLHGFLGLLIGIAQAVLYIYLPELFPTTIRASAVGFCLNCGRILTAVAVLFVGLLVPIFGGYAYALFAFACVYLVAVGSSFFGEETRVRGLPN